MSFKTQWIHFLFISWNNENRSSYGFTLGLSEEFWVENFLSELFGAFMKGNGFIFGLHAVLYSWVVACKQLFHCYAATSCLLFYNFHCTVQGKHLSTFLGFNEKE